METRIKTTYRQGSDTYVLKIGFRVAHSMKSNAHFPDPSPAPSALETACQDLQEAVNVAGRNDRTLLSAKNDKKAVVIGLLDEAAVYVTEISKGNKTMLLSSGFDIVGGKSEARPLQPISVVEVDIDTPGQATTRVKRVIGARSYVHQYTRDPITPDSVWVSETVAEREHTFNNLPSVVKLWFRVIAVGRGRKSVYSPPVSRVIQ